MVLGRRGNRRPAIFDSARELRRWWLKKNADECDTGKRLEWESLREFLGYWSDCVVQRCFEFAIMTALRLVAIGWTIWVASTLVLVVVVMQSEDLSTSTVRWAVAQPVITTTIPFLAMKAAFIYYLYRTSDHMPAWTWSGLMNMVYFMSFFVLVFMSGAYGLGVLIIYFFGVMTRDTLIAHAFFGSIGGLTTPGFCYHWARTAILVLRKLVCTWSTDAAGLTGRKNTLTYQLWIPYRQLKAEITEEDRQVLKEVFLDDTAEAASSHWLEDIEKEAKKRIDAINWNGILLCGKLLDVMYSCSSWVGKETEARVVRMLRVAVRSDKPGDFVERLSQPLRRFWNFVELRLLLAKAARDEIVYLGAYKDQVPLTIARYIMLNLVTTYYASRVHYRLKDILLVGDKVYSLSRARLLISWTYTIFSIVVALTLTRCGYNAKAGYMGLVKDLMFWLAMFATAAGALKLVTRENNIVVNSLHGIREDSCLASYLKRFGLTDEDVAIYLAMCTGSSEVFSPANVCLSEADLLGDLEVGSSLRLGQAIGTGLIGPNYEALLTDKKARLVMGTNHIHYEHGLVHESLVPPDQLPRSCIVAGMPREVPGAPSGSFQSVRIARARLRRIAR